QGDHRARHARRLQPRRPGHGDGAGPDHRRGRARGGARQSAGPGSLSRRRAAVSTDEVVVVETGTVAGAAAIAPATETPAFFSCTDLHAYYGESYIVQGVSFEVREGEILALLGRNGAG